VLEVHVNSLLPSIRRVQQNHAVEHATIHLLSERHPSLPLMGRTTPSGFLLFGQLAMETVVEAVLEALERLRQGESELATHPNCGSNIVVGGVLSGLAAWLASRGRRRSPWEQIPSALLAATAALVVARPLGPWFQQRIATTPMVDNVRLHQVVLGRVGTMTSHRVELARR
jgi:hypothetical protein